MTEKFFTEGVASTWPARTARTRSVCLPTLSFAVLTLSFDVHAFQEPLSTLHWNVAPAVVEEKPNLATAGFS